jgi:hypothetical protein
MDAGRMMMVRAGHLGGRVSHRKVLACGWFCRVRRTRMRASVSVAVICSSGAERAALHTGRMRCQSSTTMAAGATTKAAGTATMPAAAAATTTTATMTTATGGN